MVVQAHILCVCCWVGGPAPVLVQPPFLLGLGLSVDLHMVQVGASPLGAVHLAAAGVLHSFRGPRVGPSCSNLCSLHAEYPVPCQSDSCFHLGLQTGV